MASSNAALLKWANAASRGFAAAATSGPGRKVAVLGAAGGIGQPLSMLMKVRLTGIKVSDAVGHSTQF